jgi:hypothetical protein
MGKRSDFVKRARDFYPTPKEAVAPLIPFLPEYVTFIEPCAGDGRLVRHMMDLLGPDVECNGAYDIEYPTDEDGDLLPLQWDVQIADALTLVEANVARADYIITNPPWSRDKASGYILHRMIEHFAELRPTWLLFDADWMHTKQAVPYIEKYLLSVVTVGRVSWAQNGTSGKDNVAWYLFEAGARDKLERPEFWPRGVHP